MTIKSTNLASIIRFFVVVVIVVGGGRRQSCCVSSSGCHASSSSVLLNRDGGSDHFDRLKRVCSGKQPLNQSKPRSGCFLRKQTQEKSQSLPLFLITPSGYERKIRLSFHFYFRFVRMVASIMSCFSVSSCDEKKTVIQLGGPARGNPPKGIDLCLHRYKHVVKPRSYFYEEVSKFKYFNYQK